VSVDAVYQPTWLLLLKIEHMVKLQILGNNSKTVNNIKNLTQGKFGIELLPFDYLSNQKQCQQKNAFQEE
jgi:hypothetical protein